MKILIIEKYESGEDLIEQYTIYFGKDEGKYYQDDGITGKKGIRAKCKQLRNGKQYNYSDWCCTGALTKYGVIQKVLGGNGWVEGHVPDITVKDLELGITWIAADYMKRHGLTKLDGGIVVGEKIYNDIYGENVNYVDRSIVTIDYGWRENLAALRMRLTSEQIRQRGLIM